jgi:hypothetical protein
MARMTILVRAVSFAYWCGPWLLVHSYRNLIVRGKQVNLDRFPYMASLTSSNQQHECGGTLIAPDIILTAAHCANRIQQVQLGRFNRSDDSETYELYMVESYVTHPEYYANSYVTGDDVDPYDVALLKVYGQSSRPIATLANENSTLVDNEPLEAIGWGSTNAKEPSFDTLSNVLMGTTLRYTPNSICETLSGDASNGEFIDYASQIINVSLCTTSDMGSDSCTGDSGGPLIDERGIQVGIISASFGCANPVLPSLNVRVSEVRSFIDGIVCQLSDQPPSDFGCDEIEYLPSNKQVTLTISLVLDNRPDFQGWLLLMHDPLSDRLINVQEHAIFSYRDVKPYSEIFETISVSNRRQYTLVLLDAFGPGNMTVHVASDTTKLVPVTNIDFDGSYEIPFTVGKPLSFPSPSMAPSSATMTERPYLTIDLQFDEYPLETGFLVETRTNGKWDTIAAVYPGTFEQSEAGTNRTVRVDLLPYATTAREYRFIMTDNESDGMAPGFYKVYLGNVDSRNELFSGGDFYLQDVHSFVVPARTSVSTSNVFLQSPNFSQPILSIPSNDPPESTSSPSTTSSSTIDAFAPKLKGTSTCWTCEVKLVFNNMWESFARIQL